MIFVVNSDLAQIQKVDAGNFVDLKIWERKHIQEWVRQAPEVLGEDLLIVSMEFDRFKETNDRLDLLAVDRAGNLVVIELKRDAYARYADLQSLRYAAMVSSMTIDKLLPYYRYYLKSKLNQPNITSEEARTNIVEFVSSDDFEELTSRPRIILCSEGFSPEITTTVLWLNRFNIDISCIRITPHVMNEQIVIVPNKIIPTPEAKQYLIEIQEKEEAAQEETTRRIRSMKVIIENNLLKKGDVIYLKKDLPKHIKYVDSDPTYKATITGKLGRSNSIRWEKNGIEYSISALTWNIFRDLHPAKEDPGGVNGNWHWVTEKGKSLWEIAEECRQKLDSK